MEVRTCLFCSTSPDDAWVTSEYGIAVPAAQPLTPGHVVVAPRRHVAGFYDLDVEEHHADEYQWYPDPSVALLPHWR